MKNIFLASSVDCVASAIAKEISGVANKKSVFITTASEIEEGDLSWFENDRKALVDAGFQLTDYTLTGKTKDQVQEDLNDFDIIIVEGGNTFYLLRQIQKNNCAKVIKDLIRTGKTYIGSSAGSIIAGPNIYPTYCKEEIEKVPDIEIFEGLGITDLVIQPHWGSLIFKESYLQDTMEKAYTPDYKMVLLSDSQYVTISNGNFQIVDIKNI